MRHLLSIVTLFLYFVISVEAQKAETDSLFSKFNLKFSAEALKNAKLEYEQANDTIRAIMRQYYSLPMSSRAEMVENYEQRSKEIDDLINEFNAAVPKGYIVNLDIKMSDSPLRYIEDIDMQIFKENTSGDFDLVATEWDMKYPSDELDSLLNIIKWDPMTFSNIKNLMQVSNCISIQNAKEYTEVGFARSGLGKYSYLIFDKKLDTIDKIKEYNDGCQYKYYKSNVVLRYEAGMAGPQCFTD